MTWPTNPAVHDSAVAQLRRLARITSPNRLDRSLKSYVSGNLNPPGESSPMQYEAQPRNDATSQSYVIFPRLCPLSRIVALRRERTPCRLTPGSWQRRGSAHRTMIPP